jgi:hypothetical protein
MRALSITARLLNGSMNKSAGVLATAGAVWFALEDPRRPAAAVAVAEGRSSKSTENTESSRTNLPRCVLRGDDSGYFSASADSSPSS